MTITIKTKSNEILTIKVTYQDFEKIFGYDQYGRYLNLMRNRFEVLEKRENSLIN